MRSISLRDLDGMEMEVRMDHANYVSEKIFLPWSEQKAFPEIVMGFEVFFEKIVSQLIGEEMDALVFQMLQGVLSCLGIVQA
jgi:hypothetical protein